MIIEPFTMRYYADVRTLWEESEGVRLSEADSSAGIEAFIARNPGMSFVALESDRIVGALLCGHDGRRGYLHHLAVEKTQRNRGVGRALVDAAVAGLRRAGIAKCHIFVVNDNVEGIGFWARIGWERRRDIQLMSFIIGADSEPERATAGHLQ